MRSAILFTIVAAASLAVAATANAKPAKHHKHSVQRPQQQIACTVVGCVPVPPGCTQTAGRTWSGMPTGGDVIVCPPGVAPFK